MKAEFDSQPVYDNKSLNTKMMSYGGKINTDFHGKKNTQTRFSLRVSINDST